MRVRTDEKRQEIIRVAGDAFVELGYDRTSMSVISQRLGGSKATLYGYFKSKEELLLAVLENEVDEKAEELFSHLLVIEDLREALTWLATSALTKRRDVRPTCFFRIVSTQPEESGIGKTFYDTILRPVWMRLCDWIEERMEIGQLRKADPWRATMHFKGLVEGDVIERHLLGAQDGFGPAEIAEQAESAADAFMRLYGPDTPA